MRLEDTQRCVEPTIGDCEQVPCGFTLEPCHICGATSSAYEVYKGDKVYSKVICCTNGSKDGFDDCPLFMPLLGLEKATLKEAVHAWNNRPADTRMSEIIEILAGMEGNTFKPKTAPEAYLCKVIQDIEKAIAGDDMEGGE